MISEKRVQTKALSFLKKYYSGQPTFAAEEVCTKKEYGGKRADGLLVFKRWWQPQPFLVSMEAKSLRTFQAIKPYKNEQRWKKNTWKKALLWTAGLFVGYFFFSTHPLPNIWQLGAVLVMVASGWGFLSRNSYRHQYLAVIAQLRQYPAHHQWLAFAADAFQKLSTTNQRLLQRICRKRNIGLLLVNEKHNVEVLNSPGKLTYWRKWRKDYLHCYAREKEIRKKLSG